MSPSEEPKPKRVAIIDDDPSMIKVLRIMLKSSGYEVIEALKGMHGLMLVRQEKPDVVLLDIMMPDVDGFEICRKLKLDMETMDIPIIFVSAKTGAEHIERGLSLGAEGYITKPFDLKELLGKIDKAIKGELKQEPPSTIY
jgi:DNA-binding response OmpR family regulator